MAFSTEHYPEYPPSRVEWVDDTSANIVFEDAATASSALENFALPNPDFDISILPAIHLREAKRLSTRSYVILRVRTALSTDQKRPRAHEASRFYMLHPEYDPRERRRPQERKLQYGNRDYRSRRYGVDEQRRRRDMDYDEGFDPSMYNDNSRSTERDSRNLLSEDRINGGLFHPRRRADSYRLARDRSASPGNKGDAKQRRRTPPPAYSFRDPYPFPSENGGKELFPSRSSDNKGIANNTKELFSNKMLAAGLKKELFPQKVKTINHRRSDAFDAADETADLFTNGLSVSLAEGSQVSRNLADRITKGSTTDGQMETSDPVPRASRNGDDGSGISILGASSQQETGFSIRGGTAAAGTIKELFPGKALGNEGKELFSQKIHGRGGRRNRAADMFH